MRTNRRKTFGLAFAILTFPLLAHAQAQTASVADGPRLTVASTELSEPTTMRRTAHHLQPTHHAVKKTARAKKSTNGEVGLASWYGVDSGGRVTASGESLSEEFTAAHRTLPLHSKVRVTNLANGRSITVRITDRGPHLKGRIIDLSQSAAEQLGMMHRGVARVRIQPVSAYVINTAG